MASKTQPKPGRRATVAPDRSLRTVSPPAALHPGAGGAGAPGVVHLTAECWPFARTGGLGEAVSGLAAAQALAGRPTTVVMPLYRLVRETTPSLERVGPPIEVTVGSRSECVGLYRPGDEGVGPQVFFVEHPAFFDRPGLYGDNGSDYEDNALRFAFFCAAALTALPHIAPGARVVHAHDWHAALALVYLRSTFASHPFHNRLAAVLSLHNAAFQGQFPRDRKAELGLVDASDGGGVFDWYGRANSLKAGLAFSDVAVTVSPTHAAELRTPEGGFGLHETFAALGDRLSGILNGIDPARWNPETDPDIAARYSRHRLSGKAECKRALQRACGLPQRADTPVFGLSARLVAQKGLDLVLGASLLEGSDAQFVFLGSGEEWYRTALADLAARAPDRVAVHGVFTDRLEHQLLAGADLLLMPSLYEPCGLTQMRAQRYGTIPVARGVGGLRDTIDDGETGFLFSDYSPAALHRAVRGAVERYRDAPAWRAMMREAMARDFAWAGPAARYGELYRRAIGVRETTAAGARAT